MELNWQLQKFDMLTPAQLYAILRLRSEVFVVEQQCVYLDCDNKDAGALHLAAWHKEKPLAYTRLLPAGYYFTEPSIGRVVTAPEARGIKLGRELMQRSIEACHQHFGKQSIRIGAQLYLKKFYESLGFVQAGEVYLEDGIEHIEMVLPS
jgi:ElaA protein